MIVKNEAAVIERCLDSVRDLIDTWVISDTGSTDGTQELIRSALRGIPGELYEEPWRDFGHNRSLNIAHARGKADYLLLLDADLVLRRVGPLPTLTADSYMLRHQGSTEYRIKRLVRADLPWRYEGVTHEYLTCDRRDENNQRPGLQENLDALFIEDHADGGSRHDKYERDARLLGAELQRDPNNSRTVFYLAQTMRDMGDTAASIKLYERRAAMGDWAEEVYYSLLQVGVLYGDSGDWPAAMDAFSRAWDSRPGRLEACYELASRLRVLGRHHSAHAITSMVLDRAAPQDLLFVQPWVYRWGLLFEHSITAYWTGDMAGSVEACDRLLAMPDLPEEYRRQTETNRGFAVAALRPSVPVSRETSQASQASRTPEASADVSRETSRPAAV
ncbi:glycosyltransferase [Streptomyces sp. NBC_00249]|uniref:tetratricopeptide repeat-containing glycosyltransferase n=1 Tax=Streptomyces sp. NBC_00249 TaxID=2975690 RepID=UPI00225300DA|nr:glycosyltransferase [Streptomyces sp. NBC_00249]MCX5196303.1 glycosyltransferase [Streptomyces sp. NBC_00249]